jgi:hypothetical protein
MSNELDALFADVSRRWYRFGWGSPLILYQRLRNKHTPLLTLRWKWQRVQRGWSDPDMWGLHAYLARTIRDSVREMRRIANGHPIDLDHDEWLQILDEIAEGMDASLRMDEIGDWGAEDEAKFNLAMDHLHAWWFDLWD